MFPDYLAHTPAPRPAARGRLLKTHACSVSFPDGTDGTATYERLGPAYHRFDFRYGDGSAMPRQHLTRPLGNRPADIEAKARELAGVCFREAIEVERRDYFARATEPADGSRKKDPSKYRMPAGRAKEIGGKYALCLPFPSGRRYVRLSPALDCFEEAAALWRQRRDGRCVVACANRLDRCWELPKYNPLLTEGHPRREDARA